VKVEKGDRRFELFVETSDRRERMKRNRRTSRARRFLAVMAKRLIAVLMIVGSSLQGARSGDIEARAMYERRNREYRP
jgi:hypothetical protein